MAKQTFVHIGTPKSGTNFLHGVLWRNAEALREAGFLLPSRMVAHYAAARAVTSRQGESDPDTSGLSAADNAWAKLTRQVQRWNGSAFLGHPQLAGASVEQATAALDSLAEQAGDLHLVVTARALHLQPALSWQDQVKSGLATDFDTFLAGLRDDRSRGRRFWRVHDIADLVTRWGGDRVPAAHVHVVPVRPLRLPQTAGPTELLEPVRHGARPRPDGVRQRPRRHDAPAGACRAGAAAARARTARPAVHRPAATPVDPAAPRPRDPRPASRTAARPPRRPRGLPRRPVARDPR